MRDTRYARELARVAYEYPGGEEIRLERLFVYPTNQEEIRLSWWKNGKLVPRAADLPEADFIDLIRRGLDAGVLTSKFKDAMRRILAEG